MSAALIIAGVEAVGLAATLGSLLHGRRVLARRAASEARAAAQPAEPSPETAPNETQLWHVLMRARLAAPAVPVSERQFYAAAVAAHTVMARLGGLAARAMLVRAGILPAAGYRDSALDYAVSDARRLVAARGGSLAAIVLGGTYDREREAWKLNLRQISIARALGQLIAGDLWTGGPGQVSAGYCDATPRACPRVVRGEYVFPDREAGHGRDCTQRSWVAYSNAMQALGFTGSGPGPFNTTVSNAPRLDLMPELHTWLSMAFVHPILSADGGLSGRFSGEWLRAHRGWLVTRVPDDTLRGARHDNPEYGYQWMFDPKFVFYTSFVRELLSTLAQKLAFAFIGCPLREYTEPVLRAAIVAGQEVLLDAVGVLASQFAHDFDDASGGRSLAVFSPVDFADRLTRTIAAVWANFTWVGEGREPSWLDRNVGTIMRYVTLAVAAVATAGATLPGSLTEMLAQAQAYAVDYARSALLAQLQSMGGENAGLGMQLGFDRVAGVPDVQFAVTGAGSYALTATADDVRVVGDPGGAVRVESLG